MNSKAFTFKEKILLVLLVTFLLAGFYVRVVYLPTSNAIEAAEQEAQHLKVQIDALSQRKVRMDEMQRFIDEQKELYRGSVPELAQYDNFTEIMNQFNTIFNYGGSYAFTFGEPILSKEVARRVINMSFTAPSYDAAKRILAQLETGEFRCQFSELRISGSGGRITSGPVSVNATLTYFEKL